MSHHSSARNPELKHCSDEGCCCQDCEHQRGDCISRRSSDSGLTAASARRAQQSQLSSQVQQFQRVIEDRLDKECAVREAQDESQMSQLTGQRTAHEERFGNISKWVSEVEHKSREGLNSETGDAVGGQSKVSEDLPDQVQVMLDTLQNRLCEEREAKETQSEIQGSVASDDQATQARLTETEQVAQHQEVPWSG